MEELAKLVEEIEKNINAFLADAKKTKAPKQAWQRARTGSIVLAKQFKTFRALSVAVSKKLSEGKNDE
jgi:hypothetical protein